MISPQPWFGISGDVGVHVGEVFGEKSIGTILGGPVFSVVGVATLGCGRFDNGCRSDTVFSSALGSGIDIRPEPVSFQSFCNVKPDH